MMLQERMTIYCKDPKKKRETIPGRPFGLTSPISGGSSPSPP